jgi:putative transcriptional regulator
MSKKAFDRIAEGLNEALAVARGQAGGAKLHVPPEMDVRAVRAKTGLSQDRFASSFGFTVHQVRQWEQGRSRPLGAMRAYLLAIERDHAVILGLLNRPDDGREAA